MPPSALYQCSSILSHHTQHLFLVPISFAATIANEKPLYLYQLFCPAAIDLQASQAPNRLVPGVSRLAASPQRHSACSLDRPQAPPSHDVCMQAHLPTYFRAAGLHLGWIIA
eukprot:EG_transcript_48403